jgi:hypothetical protein
VVELVATWQGAWPAEVTWTGATGDGLVAHLGAAAPGPVRVQAGDQTLTVAVQPAANAGAPEIPRPTVAPLDLPARCEDDRYPALAGAFVLGCTHGLVDVALDLAAGTLSTLDPALGEAPGLGPGEAFAAGPRAVTWRSGASQLGDPARDAVGPAAVAAGLIAVPYGDGIERFELGESTRRRVPARPLPWYPMALAAGIAAWVQADPLTGQDIWTLGTDGQQRPLARDAADARHVAGSGRWLGWVEPAGVRVQDMATGERRAHPADTGFHAGISLWGPVACWEERGRLRSGEGDVGVRCSDGLSVDDRGDELNPSRWGPWLVYARGGEHYIATAQALVLDDDDPRAAGDGATVPGGFRGAHRQGGVRWTFDWPAPGWRVERWADGSWKPGEILPTGLVTVAHAGGDAVRLVPA